jgi:hypothetical protein
VKRNIDARASNADNVSEGETTLEILFTALHYLCNPVYNS